MSAVTRRDLFRSLLGRGSSVASEPVALARDVAQFALILDRYCLAHQGGFCSICSEHCPEPGAIRVTMGKPQVVADLCSGCQKCLEVCPAPQKAVFLVPKQARPGMIARPIFEIPDEA